MFGSYSRGEDTTNSDIDIAIINRKNKSTNNKKYEEQLERNININFYKQNKIHKHLQENIYNGIILAGSHELCEPYDHSTNTYKKTPPKNKAPTNQEQHT